MFTLVALEICDAGLLAVGESGEAGAASPGYALPGDRDVLTGNAAAQRARLMPRRVHHRFWDELETAPLGRPFPRGLNAADLAHAHLEAAWCALEPQPDEVLLAIPGFYSEPQLGLILGIARACGLPVRGMVDAATAAAASQDPLPAGRLLHVDVLLHRTVVSDLEVTTDEIVRRRVESRRRVGLVSLSETWARRIAELFIHATRFDPLHAAASEQELFRRLPDWLGELAHREQTMALMESSGREHALELRRRDLVAAADGAYDRIVELARGMTDPDAAATLLLSHRAAALPGLAERLAELGSVTRLASGAAGGGALQAQDAIRAGDDFGAALPFVVRLPVAGRGFAKGGALPPSPDPRPTHVVHRGRAYPITDETLRLDGLSASFFRQEGRVIADVGEGGHAALNGEPATGRVELHADDRLRLGPVVELHLITVLGRDGTPQG